jgi:hypothetical protein
MTMIEVPEESGIQVVHLDNGGMAVILIEIMGPLSARRLVRKINKLMAEDKAKVQKP